MTNERVTILSDVLAEHYEELGFLWSQRRATLRSPTLTVRELNEIEERIDAHLEGLCVGQAQTISLVEENLAAADASPVFAAAYTLLRLSGPSAERLVIGSFMEAREGQLEGMCEALCQVSIRGLEEQLLKAFTGGPDPISAAAAQVLATHSRLDPRSPRLGSLVQSESPEVRARCWRVMSCLNVFPPREHFEKAANDEESSVRREALLTATWTRQSWVLDYCRRKASEGLTKNFDAVLLLAILGKPEDLPRIAAMGQPSNPDPRTFQILGAFGHPQVIDAVLHGINSKDPVTAGAAGAAFSKMTGVAIDSDKRVQVLPEDGHEPDEFEKEFLDEVTLPSAELAQAHWKRAQPQFGKGTRWCRGFDLSQTPGADVLDQLDMESRWQACLRGKFEGTWQGGPFDLERFPQPKSQFA